MPFTIAGQIITDVGVRMALGTSLRSSWLLRFHDGDMNFTEEELARILDVRPTVEDAIAEIPSDVVLDARPYLGDQIDSNDRRAHGIYGGLPSYDFIALAREYEKRFPAGSRTVCSSLFEPRFSFTSPERPWWPRFESFKDRLVFFRGVLFGIHTYIANHPDLANLAWRAALTANLGPDDHPPGEFYSYPSCLEWMRERGILFPERIGNPGHALKILRHRKEFEMGYPDGFRDPRPILVFLQALGDHNGAFTDNYALNDLMSGNRFYTLFFEVGREEEILPILREVAHRTGRPIHTLAISGHGSSSSIELTDDPWKPVPFIGWMRRDHNHIDLSDHFWELNSLIEDGGQVLLHACSTGSGGEASDNLANDFAAQLPGRRVYASKNPSAVLNIKVNNEDLSLAVTWASPEDGYIAYVPGAWHPSISPSL